MMEKRLLFDRCLTGDRHPKATRIQKLLYFKELSGFFLFDRCLTGKAQTAETLIMELSQKLPGAATVKESLTTAEARQANAEEISELAWIEKQLEQKKEYRIIRG